MIHLDPLPQEERDRLINGTWHNPMAKEVRLFLLVLVLTLATYLLAVRFYQEKPVRTPVSIVPDSGALLERTIDSTYGIVCYNWRGSNALSCVKF